MITSIRRSDDSFEVEQERRSCGAAYNKRHSQTRHQHALLAGHLTRQTPSLLCPAASVHTAQFLPARLSICSVPTHRRTGTRDTHCNPHHRHANNSSMRTTGPETEPRAMHEAPGSKFCHPPPWLPPLTFAPPQAAEISLPVCQKVARTQDLRAEAGHRVDLLQVRQQILCKRTKHTSP